MEILTKKKIEEKKRKEKKSKYRSSSRVNELMTGRKFRQTDRKILNSGDKMCGIRVSFLSPTSEIIALIVAVFFSYGIGWNLCDHRTVRILPEECRSIRIGWEETNDIEPAFSAPLVEKLPTTHVHVVYSIIRALNYIMCNIIVRKVKKKKKKNRGLRLVPRKGRETTMPFPKKKISDCRMYWKLLEKMIYTYTCQWKGSGLNMGCPISA